MSQPTTAGPLKVTTGINDAKPAKAAVPAFEAAGGRFLHESTKRRGQSTDPADTYGANVRHKHGSEEGKRSEDQEEKTAKLWMEWRRFKAGKRKIRILDEEWTTRDNKKWLRNISGLLLYVKTETEMNHYFDSKVQTESEKCQDGLPLALIVRLRSEESQEPHYDHDMGTPAPSFTTGISPTNFEGRCSNANTNDTYLPPAGTEMTGHDGGQEGPPSQCKDNHDQYSDPDNEPSQSNGQKRANGIYHDTKSGEISAPITFNIRPTMGTCDMWETHWDPGGPAHSNKDQYGNINLTMEDNLTDQTQRQISGRISTTTAEDDGLNTINISMDPIDLKERILRGMQEMKANGELRRHMTNGNGNIRQRDKCRDVYLKSPRMNNNWQSNVAAITAAP